jgi:hypothetical protein
MKPEVKVNCITENELSLVVLPKSKVPGIEGFIHDELEDLAVIYCFKKTETGGPKHHIIMIPNDTLDAIGYTENYMKNQIKRQAVANSINKQPMQVSSIGSFISRVYDLDPQVLLEPIPMYVATVSDCQFGAKVLAYPGFFEYAVTVVGGSYYILPSSIHELILLADDGTLTVEELQNTVREINETEVSESDFLSNEVYHYDVNTKKFENASAYYNRINRLS